MKFNKICKNAAILGCSVLMLASCESDYLDTPVHGTVDATQIASTTDNARATMLAIAAGMSRYWGNGTLGPSQSLGQGETGLSYYLGEIPGPDMYYNEIYDAAPDWIMFYNQTPNSVNAGNWVWNEPMWMYCYANIAQLNELLYYIDGAEGSEEIREFTKAQTYTLRAHMYFRLLQVYGPRWEDSENGEKLCSVVLRTTVGEPNDKEVAKMNDVLALIYSDLDAAIESYGKAGSTQRVNYYEPNLNIAYGVYARVAALAHNWEKCRDMAHKARQGFRPATTKEAMSGYMAYNNNEWMWAPTFEQVDNAIFGNWCTFNTCNAYGATNDRRTNRIDIGLYRQLPETDARRDWWLTVDKLPGININMAYNKRAVNPVNQQFTAANLLRAARTWLDEHQSDYGIPGLKAYNGTGSGTQSTSIICDGAQVKFWCDGETGNNTLAQIPFMRATEMYLYEAEACAELDLLGEAKELLKEINTPHNPSYVCNASSKQEVLDEVRLYRRIELWGEGFCWFDFKRWNIPAQRTAWIEGDTNSGNMPEPLCAPVPTKRNNGWRHGIPIGERNRNTAITSAIPGETLTDE